MIRATTTTEDLLAKVARLEAELAESRKENERLRTSQSELRVELELMRRRIFVARAERVDTRQLELEFATKLAHLNRLAEPTPTFPSLLNESITDKKGTKKSKRKPKGRRDLCDVNLPEVRVDITDPVFEELVKEGRAIQMGSVLSYKLAYQRGGHRKLVIARTTIGPYRARLAPKWNASGSRLHVAMDGGDRRFVWRDHCRGYAQRILGHSILSLHGCHTNCDSTGTQSGEETTTLSQRKFLRHHR